ncbi:hypothetical protein PSP47_001549 [Escherichia coli]|nr:hypothetical protein [Escherichia coli]
MRVLLRPVPVPELGLVVLKPGRESMQVFHNPRVLVEPEPKSMRGLPSGVVPAVRQCIDSREVRKKPGGYWIIRDLTGLDLVGLASL